jgi:hypothetical protein
MKDSRSAVRDLPQGGVEPEADPYMDEAMAMVYVGDVYSLVAQDGMASEIKAKPAEDKIQKQEQPQPRDDNDALWPLIR